MIEPKVEITETFTITTSPRIMKRFKRFLALLHCNSGFGHSGTFAMPLDGDGPEKFSVTGHNKGDITRYSHAVDMTGSIGGAIEVALDDCYTAYGVKRLSSDYIVRDSASLYVNGDLEKTYPSADYNYKEDN